MPKQPNRIIARHQSGAIMLNHKVPGMTQKIDKESAGFYGGKHFVCESLSMRSAKAIVLAMGWKWIGIEKFPEIVAISR